MRHKYLPLLLILFFILAACGSNTNQTSTASQAIASAPACRSSLPTNLSIKGITPPQSSPHTMNMGPHMIMTSNRPITAEDMARIEALVQNAHACFDKYKDYRVALRDGYQIFTPDVPQDVYHFASTQNFQKAQTRFDLAHPSALLYNKVGDGWKFVGVMYSAPANANEDQLNALIPLSVAPWHLHVNICLPAGNESRTLFDANSLFGLTGTLTTQAQCDRVSGTFIQQLFGWMVHIPLFGSVGAG